MAQPTSDTVHSSSPPSAFHPTDDTEPTPRQTDANRHELAFPVVHISKSLADLASSEASLKMTRNKAAEQTASQLETSTFELLGESAILSDVETDDGNTASLTSQSVDGLTPDDLSSLAGTEDDEHYETVTRQDIEQEEHGVGGEDELSASNFSTSEDEADHKQARPRQAEGSIEESELTVRPTSSQIDIHMSPSLHHLRAQDMTDSELLDYRHGPRSRARMVQEVKDTIIEIGQGLYQDVRMHAVRVIADTRHVSKTARRTYEANPDAFRSYAKIIGQVVLGLLGTTLLVWMLSHLTITVNTKGPLSREAVTAHVVPNITPSWAAVSSMPTNPISEALAAPSSASSTRSAKSKALATGMPSDVGAPQQKVTAEETSDFVAHILGDNHFILTPSKQFLNQRKQPQIFVNVIRDGETIPAAVSKYDGVYAVEIDRAQAWGSLDVMIYSKSKPKIRQEFTLNFGSPWLKLSIWQASAEKLSRTAREEWSTVNGFVATAIQQARKELQVMRTHLNNDATERAAGLGDRAAALQKDLIRVLAAQSKALSSNLAEMQESVTKELSIAACEVKKDVAKIYKSVSNVDLHTPLKQLQTFHAQVAARAQTNAANIVKKLKQHRSQRKEVRNSKVAEKLHNKLEKARKHQKAKKAGDTKACRASKKHGRQCNS